MNGAVDRGVYRLPVMRSGIGVLIYNELHLRIFINSIRVFYTTTSVFFSGFVLWL